MKVLVRMAIDRYESRKLIDAYMAKRKKEINCQLSNHFVTGQHILDFYYNI